MEIFSHEEEEYENAHLWSSTDMQNVCGEVETLVIRMRAIRSLGRGLDLLQSGPDRECWMREEARAHLYPILRLSVSNPI